MKTTPRFLPYLIKSTLTGVSALIFCSASLSAATITADGSALNVSVAPGGSDGYLYFSPNPNLAQTGGHSLSDLSSLPGYATYTPALGDETTTYNDNSGDAFSLLQIGGTPYRTGVNLIDNAENNVLGNLGSFTFSGIVPNAFRFGVLMDNVSNALNLTNITLTIDGHSVALTSLGVEQTNNFFYVMIVGAQATDILTITGDNIDGRYQPTVGGFTFDPVPEPSTAGLIVMGLGLAGGLKLLRRRTA